MSREKKESKLKSYLLGFVDHEFPDSFLEDIKSKRHVQRLLNEHPDHDDLLYESFREVSEEYGGIVNWAKLIDKWDRYSSLAGLASNLVPGVGQAFSIVEDVGELIPKSIYAVNYVQKTGDYMAVPHWAAREALSFIPFFGDFLDLTNAYINRTKKTTTKAIIKRFKEKVENSRKERGTLEKRVS